MGKGNTQKVSTSVPSWLSSGIKSTVERAGSLLNADPESYTADWNPFQQEAADRATTLGQSNPFRDRATSIMDTVGNYKTPQVTAASLLDNLDKYMSPYTEQVVDSSLRGFDQDTARSLAAMDLKQAGRGAGAYGGSGAAIERGVYSADRGQDRSLTEIGLRDQGFRTGAELSGQDAARRQQASSENASLALAKQNQGLDIARMFATLGEADQANQRADIATILGIGDTIYGVESQDARAPVDILKDVSSIYGSLPTDLFKTTTVKSGGSNIGAILGGLGTLAQGAGALGLSFSDERLKRDVTTVGYDDKGRRWVDFAYIWDEPGVTRRGLIAQEVSRTDPQAVREHETGYLMVDYGAL